MSLQNQNYFSSEIWSTEDEIKRKDFQYFDKVWLYLNNLVSKSESPVPGSKSTWMNVIDENLSVPLFVLILVAKCQTQQLARITTGSLQLNLLENIVDNRGFLGFT